MRKIWLLSSCFVLFTSTVAAQDTSQVATVGKPAPDVTLTGIDGKTFKLSDVTASGKNVALMMSRAHW